jgi:hypothetical protein
MNRCFAMAVLSDEMRFVAEPPTKDAEKPPPLGCRVTSSTTAPRGTLPYAPLLVSYSGCALDVRFLYASYLRRGAGWRRVGGTHGQWGYVCRRNKRGSRAVGSGRPAAASQSERRRVIRVRREVWRGYRNAA